MLVAFGTVGAVLGDSFSYLIGRRWGMTLVRRWGWLRRRLEPRFERAHGYFDRRGGRAVFVARWVGALRALVPLVAGTATMPFRRFLLWDAAAAVLWVTAMVWLGVLLGDDMARVVDRVGTGISLVVVGVIALVVLLRHEGDQTVGDGLPDTLLEVEHAVLVAGAEPAGVVGAGLEVALHRLADAAVLVEGRRVDMRTTSSLRRPPRDRGRRRSTS